MSENDRIREHQLRVWLLEEEKELLKKSAFEYGLSQSDYIRQLIVGGAVVGRQWTMDKEQGKQIIFELNRIGNNVNQIAYSTNAKAYASTPEWQALRKNFLEVLSLIGKLPFLTKETQEEWLIQVYTLSQQL